MNLGRTAGSQSFLASGVLGVSGHAKRIFMVHIVNIDNAGAGTAILHNGTGSGDTVYIQETSPLGDFADTFDYGNLGFKFPAGTYVELSGNAYSVTVSFWEEP